MTTEQIKAILGSNATCDTCAGNNSDMIICNKCGDESTMIDLWHPSSEILALIDAAKQEERTEILKEHFEQPKIGE